MLRPSPRKDVGAFLTALCSIMWHGVAGIESCVLAEGGELRCFQAPACQRRSHEGEIGVMLALASRGASHLRASCLCPVSLDWSPCLRVMMSRRVSCSVTERVEG